MDLAALGNLLLWIIPALAVVHFVGLIVLLVWRWVRLKRLAEHLRDATRDIDGRTTPIIELTPASETLAYCEDILAQVSRGVSHAQLQGLKDLQRIKPYRKLRNLQRCYAVGIAITESYPMLGILGTVLSIAAYLPDLGGAPGAQETVDLSPLISAFGTALYTTIYGLVAAVSFMIAHSLLDSDFNVLTEVRIKYEEIVRAVRLADQGMPAAEPGTGPHA